MAIKNQRTQETQSPEAQPGEKDRKPREKAEGALRRDIGRIASHIRAGGQGGDDGGSDV
ncbi:hypothetical protein [Nannocystis punicea]|uniref:CsbD family protein n=1 Tax=Nannocystis punicea TaxID=2995304 RepID=A0ABY7GV54_9BACT|nr:hypothetical protein [Nannocystis poenicansa]WAS90828.1 hypothetical protein O0S08_31960 [Nannocystis poenicansa]